MSRAEELIAAYLDDSLTEPDEAELKAWLSADASNVRAFVEANVREQQLRAAVLARRDLRQLVGTPSQLTIQRPSVQPRQLRLATTWAAAAAIVIVSVLMLWPKAAQHEARLGGDVAGVKVERDGASLEAVAEMKLKVGDVVRVQRGGTRIEIVNEDTHFMLAPRSAVALRQLRGQKRFELLSGSVEAEVAKQREGAMIWTTEDAETHVIGTKFALTADGMLTRLDVTEGAVELLGRGTAQATMVRAGERSATDSQGILTPRAIADADSPIAWNVPSRTTSNCEHTTFHSETLAAEVGMNVLLPPNYSTQPARRFPVLYFLHGLGGDEHTEAARFAGVMRSAMERGELPSFIAVFPNGGPGYTPLPVAAGRVFARELPHQVDARFRTLATRESRMLCGLGYGGKRAVLFGTIDADVFGTSCAIDDTFRGGTPSFLRLIEALHGRIERNPPHLLLLHGQPHASEFSSQLVSALRSRNITVEAKSLPALTPESTEYTAAIAIELRALLMARWSGR